MARIGAKRCQNAFQTIPDVSFFDARKKFAAKFSDRKLPFSFIDAGCGNGWVVRKVSKISNCTQAVGIDGSEKMILKARKIDPKLNYYCADLMSWAPKKKVDLVHSMEVFYYLEDPKKLIDNMVKELLKIPEVNESQENTKYRLFKEYFLKSFSSRLAEYTNPEIEVQNKTILNENYTIVNSILIGTSERPEVKIDWRIYTKNPDNPLIRDLIIEGLSLARTQKEEFASILNSNDGDINFLFKSLDEFSKN